MNLIIVESPTKARTLGRFLGSEYKSLATTGHIKDLPKSKLGVDVEKNFKATYETVKGREKTIKEIVAASKKADNTFIATDPDREGEAIAGHIEDFLAENKVDPARIVFHEITKSAVEDAIKSPGKINKSLINAQIARRVLDRLVGYKLSPLLWKKVRRGLSAGRVQSVVVRLIVEKEDEIKTFKPQIYFEVFVTVKKKTGKKESFVVELDRCNDKKIELKEKKASEKIIDELGRGEYRVFDVVKKEVSRRAVPPFTTSTMTQAASRTFYWSAKKTMSVAQKLYEEGLITYHRTDSLNISKSAIDMARGYISKNFGEKYVPAKPNFYKTKSKSAQEAHEAIRPTDIGVDFSLEDKKFIKDAEKLYKLVWKRFLASQMSPAIFDATTIVIESRGENVYLLKTSGQIVKFDGWKRVWGKTEEDTILPDVVKDENLDFVKVDSVQKSTQPPARYSEATLIKTLEKLGIGRPSTYAPTISTIQTRSYVIKDEGRFFPTTVGYAVNTFLTKNFSTVVDYDFTAKMESDLDDVAGGELKWQEMMKDFYSPFEKKLKSVEKNAERVKIETEKLGKKCPDCVKEGLPVGKQGELVIRIGRFGKFISCSRFPECRFTDKYEDRIGMKCPDCGKGEVILKVTKRRRKFYGCNRYPKCKFASWKKPGEKLVEEKNKGIKKD